MLKGKNLDIREKRVFDTNEGRGTRMYVVVGIKKWLLDYSGPWLKKTTSIFSNLMLGISILCVGMSDD